MKIKFNESRLFLFAFDKEAAAAYLGISRRQLDNWLEEGFAPEESRDQLSKIGKLALFPLDDPPAADVIGESNWRAFEALQRGDEEQAEAFTAKVLFSEGIDWKTGHKLSLTPLQRFYAELANGIAWARNLGVPDTRHGLFALRDLRRRVWLHIKKQKIDDQHQQWNAWSYLAAMTDAYWLTYLSKYIPPAQDDVARASRQIPAMKITSLCQPLLDHRVQFAGTNVASFIAWNAAQYAAVAEHDAMFIQCLDVLARRNKSKFKLIWEMLTGDEDTAPMLQNERVMKYFSAFLQDDGM